MSTLRKQLKTTAITMPQQVKQGKKSELQLPDIFGNQSSQFKAEGKIR